MALLQIGVKAEGRQQVVFTLDNEHDAAEALESQGLFVEYVRPVADDKWFTTDREGIMVTLEEGDVEFPEPIMQFPVSEVSVYGSESASDLLTQAGVSKGYGEVVADIKARGMGFPDRKVVDASTLDEDDLARIATALKIAWQNGLDTAAAQKDPDMAEVQRGMAGSYSQTLDKVERLLDGGE